MVKDELMSAVRAEGSAMGTGFSPRKVRVLIFVDRFLRGGIQTLLWNIAETIDRNRFDVTFLTLDDGTGSYPMENDLRKRGYEVEKLVGIWLRSPIDYVRYYSALRRFFESHSSFDAVHMHSSSKNFPILQVAKRYGVPVRIAHSHSTGFQSNSALVKILGTLLSFGIRRYANCWLACSAEAGRWMFGSSFDASPKSHIMRNALPLEQYRYSSSLRLKKREELRIGNDALLVVNVARLSKEKNQTFLLSVISKLVDNRVNCMLLLVGEGPMKDSLQQRARQLGIENKVRFLGFRNDVQGLLMASDVMVMPSFREGLPYAAIEAQATGLPCVVSSSISPEAIILPSSRAISLEEKPKKWADMIVRSTGSFERTLAVDILRERGFDLAREVNRLESIYCEGLLSMRGELAGSLDE